jgi:hypothetical protein
MYHPEEGVFDFDSYFSNPQVDPWNSFDIDDPDLVNTFLAGGGLQGGYISPEGKLHLF